MAAAAAPGDLGRQGCGGDAIFSFRNLGLRIQYLVTRVAPFPFVGFSDFGLRLSDPNRTNLGGF
jgi:hypothetical protein